MSTHTSDVTRTAAIGSNPCPAGIELAVHMAGDAALLIISEAALTGLSRRVRPAKGNLERCRRAR